MRLTLVLSDAVVMTARKPVSTQRTGGTWAQS